MTKGKAAVQGSDEDYHIKQMVREFLLEKIKKSGEEGRLVGEVKRALAKYAADRK